MDVSNVWESLIQKGEGTIIYLILDGLGGLPDSNKGGTELQVARTPNLDLLAKRSSCGLLEMVGPGITPGSGPGHLALFGYEPLKYNLGRGILSALGIDFSLKKGDVAARVNFATADENGRILDRRAGRIDTGTNQRLCKKIRDGLNLEFDGDFFFETVSEHRALLVLRGPHLEGNLGDTDPQKTGTVPLELRALSEEAEKTAQTVRSFIDQVGNILSDEERANMILLRGFDQYEPLPSLEKRFGLRGICIADYPMYRGISRLLGMEVTAPPDGAEESFRTLTAVYGENHDYYFLHLKKTDSTGEDADFDRKVEAIEMIDQYIPQVMELQPNVLVVTGDHSTPALMGVHSWHPVPVIIHSQWARVDDVDAFDEYSCLRGSLGLRPGIHLMGLALAHAKRLKKFGA
jgi:2,3-bisphosphoglycerate-independent phosphoglycerate mutase